MNCDCPECRMPNFPDRLTLALIGLVAFLGGGFVTVLCWVWG
jgi:hypothetical protein